MLEFIKSISINEWLLFLVVAISLLSLLVSVLAYRRAGYAFNKIQTSAPTLDKHKNSNAVVERYKSAEVSLKITAQRDVSNQLRLVLKNNGIVVARDIDLTIGEPVRVINQQQPAAGVSGSINFKDSSLQPRLTVIDSLNVLPISEVAPGVAYDFFAVITMGYGKICDFPVSLNWIDDRGYKHYLDDVMTI